MNPNVLQTCMLLQHEIVEAQDIARWKRASEAYWYVNFNTYKFYTQEM